MVDDIKSRMDVKVEGEDTFLLTYADSEPGEGQGGRQQGRRAVHEAPRRAPRAGRVGDRGRRSRPSSTTLQPQLDEADKAVREFKTKHYGSLPEQQEANLRTLDQTTMELNIQSTNLDMDNERRRQLLAAAMSPLRHQEETLAAQLYDARTKYTDGQPRGEEHPGRVREGQGAAPRGREGPERQGPPQQPGADGARGRDRPHQGDARRVCAQRQTDVRKRVDETAKNGQELAGLQLDLRRRSRRSTT